MTTPDPFLMREAIDLARRNLAEGGRPFGAVLVLADRVLARAANRIHATNDPTAHAELLAIREASQVLGSPDLKGAVIYASGQPCPMCRAAMIMCGVSAAWYAYSNEDAAAHGLSTGHVQAQLALPPEEQTPPMHPFRPEGEDGLYDGWKPAR